MSYLQEAKPTDRQANQIAAKFGFRPTGETSAHRQQYKDEAGNVVYFSKTTSDRRAYKNFKAQIRRQQRTNPLPVKPEVKPKPEGLPTKVDKVIKTTRLSSAQRRESNKTTRSGTPTTFRDFMDKLKPQPPKPPSLQQRMSQGYSNTIRSLPLSVKVEMGNDIIKRMRYKPGQRYGISGIGLADEYIPEAVSKSDKLTGRLKMLYNLPSDKKKYFKQQNPPEVDRLKKAQGNALTPQVAQIAPMKTTVVGPDLKSLPHIDCRGPGQKLCSVMNQARYSRETGRTPPKIP